MRNKSGFTLIELLAIIVILAIIALITVPIILGIIDNSKKGAAIDSAYGYKEAVGNWYVSKLQENGSFKLNGMYTVADGTLNNEDVLLSGTKPTKGYLKYNNNNLEDACLAIGGYEVKYQNSQFIITGKGICEVEVDFENDSWETILANLNRDRNCYDGEIGKTRIENMNLEGTAKDYKLRLVNTASCPSTYSGSKTSCGVVIEFVTTIGNHQMKSSESNSGGWYSSLVRAYLNTDADSIYDKLKVYLGENTIILTNPVISGSSIDTEDYLYLLSTRELGILDYQYDQKNSATDTNILEYYGGDDISDTSRIKYDTVIESSDSSQFYWLRSASTYNHINFCNILKYYGTVGGSPADNSLGVAPAFRIMD